MSNRLVLQLDPTPANARNSEATFVTLRGRHAGRVLLVWSKFIGEDHSDFGAGVIACRWSDDAGDTWSDRERVLVEKDAGATNVMSPSLLRLRDGRIALFYLRKEGTRICMPLVRYSTDEGETFSEPDPIIREPGYYVVNNDRVIQAASGRIVIPTCLSRYRGPSELKPIERLPGDTTTHYPSGLEPFFAYPGIVLFYFSDDGGKTWLESLTSFYHCQADGSGLEEPGVVELTGGALWSYSRTGLLGLAGCGNRQWESFSRDGGQVWSRPEPSAFVSPCSPMHVKRIPGTGHLLAVWNDQSGHFRVPPPEPVSWGRTPLVAAISEDEGKTWGRRLLLEDAPDHGFCYPAIHFHGDVVLLAYNAGGATSSKPLDTQRVRRLTLDEFYR